MIKKTCIGNIILIRMRVYCLKNIYSTFKHPIILKFGHKFILI